MHPIVAQMQPSAEQVPAVRARGRDVVVTAGAGTGKTRTLVARYLALVAEGLPLRSIVAITFTRKAAREMRNRVRAEIRRILEGADLPDAEAGGAPAPARQRWQGLYAELDAARIGTIHSLCAEILRSHPAEAGVDPRFEVLEEGQGNILVGEAVDEALGWAADQVELQGLFSLAGERMLRATLAAMIRQRLDAEAVMASLPDPLWPAWEERLLAPVRAFVDDPGVGADFEALRAVRDDGTLGRAEAAGDKLAAPLGRLLTLWAGIEAARAAGEWGPVVADLPALRGEMPSVGQAKHWSAHDPRPVLAGLRARYDGTLKEWLGKGLDLAWERESAEAVPALRALFQQAAGAYRRRKEERQALDYDDLEAGALALLDDPQTAAVRRRWEAEVQAILVDEFQDTNGRQRDLVARLNGEGGRLFLVGDAKQSIYRFRGADVEVFRRERERIEGEGGAAFTLGTSYRAHRELVAGLNDLLRPVLGEEADPERPWAEPFAPLRHHREEAGPGLSAPHVELHLAVGPKSGGALGRAAEALAGRIVELASGEAQVEESGRLRPLGYGDVAILCRASTSFGAYEDALERAGVPFLTVAGRGFYGRPEIRDLLNALQALADPTDDLALAGLLRSPAFGLSDAALYHLCQQRAESGASLWEALHLAVDGNAPALMAAQSDAPALAAAQSNAPALAEEREKAERAAEAIARLHGQVGRTTVADVLKAFLDTTDYRAALIRAGQARGARNVAKLLADAHASGIVGVGEFVEYVAGLRDSGTREGEARATAEGAVQIMTVHAAKGLEFPVVVLGDATYEGRGGGGLLLDPELGPLLPVRDEEKKRPAIYRLGQRRLADREEAEADRLLYVAATRAREKLIVSGCLGLNRDGSIRKPGGWLGKLDGEEGVGLAGRVPDYDPEGAGAERWILEAGSTPVACTIYEPGYRWEPGQRERSPEPETDVPPPGDAGTGGRPPLLEPVLAEVGAVDGRVAQQERDPPPRVWRVVPTVERPRAPAWVIGSLVHEALAGWRFPPRRGPAQRDEPEPAFERWGEARARGYGLTDPRQIADAVGQCRRLLRRLREHALYEEMDTAEPRLHEVPYSLEVDGRVESGILDALYRRDGRWTVVEFKTDEVRNEAELERVLAEGDYLAQANRYRGAVERLLGERPRLVVCWLNFEGRVRVDAQPEDPHPTGRHSDE